MGWDWGVYPGQQCLDPGLPEGWELGPQASRVRRGPLLSLPLATVVPGRREQAKQQSKHGLCGTHWPWFFGWARVT